MSEEWDATSVRSDMYAVVLDILGYCTAAPGSDLEFFIPEHTLSVCATRLGLMGRRGTSDESGDSLSVHESGKPCWTIGTRQWTTGSFDWRATLITSQNHQQATVAFNRENTCQMKIQHVLTTVVACSGRLIK